MTELELSRARASIQRNLSRRSSGGGSRPTKRALLGGIGVAVVTLTCLVLSRIDSTASGAHSSSASAGWGHRRSLQAGALHTLGLTHRVAPTLRRSEAEKFATLWHSELADHYKMTEGQASADVDELVRTLRKMEEAQVTTVQFSMPWDWLQQV